MEMDGNNVKKDDENGQLSCGIYYSSPAAAHLLLQRLGRRSLNNTVIIYTINNTVTYVWYHVRYCAAINTVIVYTIDNTVIIYTIDNTVHHCTRPYIYLHNK